MESVDEVATGVSLGEVLFDFLWSFPIFVVLYVIGAWLRHVRGDFNPAKTKAPSKDDAAKLKAQQEAYVAKREANEAAAAAAEAKHNQQEAEDAKRKATEAAQAEAKAAAEAKQKADEEAAKAVKAQNDKADQEAQAAADEAKRKADSEALAADEAKRKADKEATAAAEAKRKADEDAAAAAKHQKEAEEAAAQAAQKAEEAKRQAEEKEAKRKADEDAAAAAKHQKEAEEAAAQAAQKAEEAKRQAEEKEAKRKADEDAEAAAKHKKEAEAAAAAAAEKEAKRQAEQEATTAEAKEEPKEEAKEEPKEEAKEEPKEEPKKQKDQKKEKKHKKTESSSSSDSSSSSSDSEDEKDKPAAKSWAEVAAAPPAAEHHDEDQQRSVSTGGEQSWASIVSGEATAAATGHHVGDSGQSWASVVSGSASADPVAVPTTVPHQPHTSSDSGEQSWAAIVSGAAAHATGEEKETDNTLQPRGTSASVPQPTGAPSSSQSGEQGVERLKYGVGSIQGMRPSMEDAHVTMLGNMKANKQFAFFGVYDGHAGGESSEYIGANFHHAIDKCLAAIEQEEGEQLAMGEAPFSYETKLEKRKQAIAATFGRFDDELQEESDMNYWYSGATVVTALVDLSSDNERSILCANLGDSRCVLYVPTHDDSVKAMSDDHKPENAEERQRIEKSGHFVAGGRLDGTHAISRAMGDFDMKRNLQLGASEQAISNVPEFKDVRLASNDQSFVLILACDGLWDVMTNEEAVQWIKRRLPADDLDKLAQELVEHAVSIGSTDNVSAIIAVYN
eukprot:TRINITY_DN5113_c1_g2_i1.p1 TRINITY_DN5113_c1_g2~~TRINITY_DN5113_c1_g2_i1.p1  ORF type:complete len:788 (-),score=282.34 TRINITY_DN5113_c1_g2_i1:71-2434(-)